MAEEAAKDVAEDKAIVPLALPPSQEEKDKPDDDSKAVAILETKALVPVEKSGSIDRDATLARFTTEKRLSLIKAWEESEK